MTKTYVMAKPRSCGPDGLLFALLCAGYRVTRDDLLRAWQWPDSDGLADDLRDSPGAHYRVLGRLGVPWALATCGDIIEGRVPANRTLVLIHAKDDPDTALPEDLLHQHWVVFAGRQGAAPGRCLFHFGDGSVRPLSDDQVRAAYAATERSGPTCAYVVFDAMEAPPGTKQHHGRWAWLAQQWDKAVSAILRLLGRLGWPG